jgi:hypothetical protein
MNFSNTNIFMIYVEPPPAGLAQMGHIHHVCPIDIWIHYGTMNNSQTEYFIAYKNFPQAGHPQAGQVQF